ncbi:MAG: hypothetical protein N3A38_13985, partial [Planctomycetota bacterium]|nr:hypothetical protein [Planctomycetota bacterium]
MLLRIIRSKYLRESALYAGGIEVSLAVFGVLQTLALGIWLPREGYGIWGYVAGMVGMAGVFTIPGIAHVVIYGAAHGQDGCLWHGTRIRLLGGAVSSVFLLAIAGFHALAGRKDIALVLAIAGIFAPALQALDTMDAFLMGRGDFRSLFARRIACGASTSGAVALAAWGTSSVLWCYVAFCLAGAILTGSLFIRAMSMRSNRAVPENFGPLTRRFAAQSAAASLTNHFERPLLKTLVSFEELAAYNMAKALLLPVGFGRLVDQILVSRLARREYAVDVSTVMRGMWFMLAAGALAWGACTAGIWLLVPVLLPRYEDCIPLATVLLSQMPFAWGARPGMSLLLARGEHHGAYHRLVWAGDVIR